MTSLFIRCAALVAVFFSATASVQAIELETYRKIRSGLPAAEVLLIAGEPDSRQRQRNCETWFYRGTDYALENKLVVVSLCDNKVMSTTTTMSSS